MKLTFSSCLESKTYKSTQHIQIIVQQEITSVNASWLFHQMYLLVFLAHFWRKCPQDCLIINFRLSASQSDANEPKSRSVEL